MALKRNLHRKILLGLLSASVLYAQFPPLNAEAASLYDEYQAQQAAKNSTGRNIRRSDGAEAQKVAAQAAEDQKSKAKKKSSKKSSGQEAAESTGESPTDFAARVGRIIDEYYSGRGRQATSSTAADTQGQTQAQAQEQQKPAASFSSSQRWQTPTPNEGRYDFDWRGTPLAQSVYAVAKIAGKGIVINGDLKGTVYLSLKQATCPQTLDYLARAYEFNWMIDGNNIIVSTSDKMEQSDVIEVAYADKDKIKEELKSLGIEEKNIYANAESGTVSITGTPYQIQQAKERVRRIDRPVSQCLLVAQLIEVTHGKDLNLGIQYTLPTYSHTGDDSSDGSEFHGKWLGKFTFAASMQANRAISKGHVIARPMVVTTNGQAGKVSFGDEVPILSQTSTSSSTNVTVEYKDVGTNLTMTPSINERTGEIALKIEVEVSNITGWLTSGQTRAPQIATRKATTAAHLQSGESLVIGGLMSVRELDNLSGIPGLMNLPILGELFKYHSRSKEYGEVFVMLTPYIVSEGINPTEILRKAGE